MCLDRLIARLTPAGRAVRGGAGGRIALPGAGIRRTGQTFMRGRTTPPVDDFEREYPGFDWKNTPAYMHPGGKDCPCPKHEYVREQISYTKQVNDAGGSAKVTLKFCPDHYRVYKEEVIPAMPLKYRLLTKLALRIGAVKVERLGYMDSERCFYCKFGSGGHGRRPEIPVE